LGDFVSGYEASPFFGIGAPKHTPRPVIEKLNKAINGALAEPKAAELLARFGGIPIMGSPDDFGELLRAEIRKWGNAVKAARMKSS
jgi:tripartite-type tricarboxylate transporter receptor subunit TctC